MASERVFEDVTPLTMSRRDYILNHLQKNKDGTWIRISSGELSDFGGAAFFEGCTVTAMTDGQWFVATRKIGFDHNPPRKVLLNIRITSREAWTPPGYSFVPWYSTMTSTNSTITLTNTTIASHSITNEGKPTMEHHIDRSKLTDVVEKNKEAYSLVRERAQALYRDEIEKLTEQHLAGEIATAGINVRDKGGNLIQLPADQTDQFDKLLRALELDSRDVVILNDAEYQVFVESTSTNLVQVAEVLKKLEER